MVELDTSLLTEPVNHVDQAVSGGKVRNRFPTFAVLPAGLGIQSGIRFGRLVGPTTEST